MDILLGFIVMVLVMTALTLVSAFVFYQILKRLG